MKIIKYCDDFRWMRPIIQTYMIAIKHHNAEDKNILISKLLCQFFQNGINLLFDLGNNRDHLRFYPQSNVQSTFWPHRSIPISENPMVDAKIVNLLQLWQKGIFFVVWLWEMTVILHYLSLFNGENSTSPWISLYTYQWVIINILKKSQKRFGQNSHFGCRTKHVHFIFSTALSCI